MKHGAPWARYYARMATGDHVTAPEGDTAEARTAPYVLIPPEEAAAQALAAYFRRAKFWIWAGVPEIGETSRRREFELADVLDDWPAPDRELAYPTLAITGNGASEHMGGFTPSPLECSWDQSRGTVLWQVGWVSGELQLDFWADSRPLRNALGAQLHGLMNPRESMSGLLLQAPETFACLPIRYLLRTGGSIEVADSVFANERRYSATVGFEAPLIDERQGRAISVTVPFEVT